MTASLLEQRGLSAETRLSELREKLTSTDSACESSACVYVTGSFGRGEASSHSDLDLFIVGLTERDEEDGGAPKRLFSPIDEALLKADLIRAARTLGFPEFDRDGQFLAHHSLDDLVGTLGHPRDDVVNTFTARLLLLLESRALLNPETYASVIDRVIEAYWVDFKDHEASFVPAYLLNDILRLWRTFCVNYEAFTKREPRDEKAKRRLKNYKLRHSRLLTCYSAIAYLLEAFREASTVAPERVRDMVQLPPTQRLIWLAERRAGSEVEEHAKRCLDLYEEFLHETDAPKEQLIDRFLDPDHRRRFGKAANKFGDEMYHLLSAIDPEQELFRFLVI